MERMTNILYRHWDAITILFIQDTKLLTASNKIQLNLYYNMMNLIQFFPGGYIYLLSILAGIQWQFNIIQYIPAVRPRGVK